MRYKLNLNSLRATIGGRSSFSPYGAYTRDVTSTSIKNYISQVQFTRLAHDIKMWRDSIREAELAMIPHRVKMQRMYMDTVISPDIFSLLEKWDELTTQRDYTIYQIKNGKQIQSDSLTEQIKEQYWFSDYLKYVNDAQKFGYSLISLGDIENDSFPNISIVPRENIRPDGVQDYFEKPIVTSTVYAVDGLRVMDDKLMDMANHWIPTPTERGTSVCGYGFLYKLAYLEINLRHVNEWNLDFAEGFGQPIKKGSTSKTGSDRDDFEAFLRSSGSNQWILLDKATDDEVSYEHAQSVGTAWKTYDNLEERLLAKAAQVTLGHSDAMKSTAGKLGGFQTGEDNGKVTVVQQALNSKQISAGNFTVRKINEVGAPRFRKLGKYVGSKIIENLIPEGYKFGLLNDKEEEEVKRKVNENRTSISLWASNLNKAGFDIDAEQLSEITGLKLKAVDPTTRQIQERKTESTVVRVDASGNKIPDIEK